MIDVQAMNNVEKHKLRKVACENVKCMHSKCLNMHIKYTKKRAKYTQITKKNKEKKNSKLHYPNWTLFTFYPNKKYIRSLTSTKICIENASNGKYVKYITSVPMKTTANNRKTTVSLNFKHP